MVGVSGFNVFSCGSISGLPFGSVSAVAKQRQGQPGNVVNGLQDPQHVTRVTNEVNIQGTTKAPVTAGDLVTLSINGVNQLFVRKQIAQEQFIQLFTADLSATELSPSLRNMLIKVTGQISDSIPVGFQPKTALRLEISESGLRCTLAPISFDIYNGMPWNHQRVVNGDKVIYAGATDHSRRMIFPTQKCNCILPNFELNDPIWLQQDVWNRITSSNMLANYFVNHYFDTLIPHALLAKPYDQMSEEELEDLCWSTITYMPLSCFFPDSTQLINGMRYMKDDKQTVSNWFWTLPRVILMSAGVIELEYVQGITDSTFTSVVRVGSWLVLCFPTPNVMDKIIDYFYHVYHEVENSGMTDLGGFYLVTFLGKRFQSSDASKLFLETVIQNNGDTANPLKFTIPIPWIQVLWNIIKLIIGLIKYFMNTVKETKLATVDDLDTPAPIRPNEAVDPVNWDQFPTAYIAKDVDGNVQSVANQMYIRTYLFDPDAANFAINDLFWVPRPGTVTPRITLLAPALMSGANQPTQHNIDVDFANIEKFYHNFAVHGICGSTAWVKDTEIDGYVEAGGGDRVIYAFGRSSQIGTAQDRALQIATMDKLANNKQYNIPGHYIYCVPPLIPVTKARYISGTLSNQIVEDCFTVSYEPVYFDQSDAYLPIDYSVSIDVSQYLTKHSWCGMTGNLMMGSHHRYSVETFVAATHPLIADDFYLNYSPLSSCWQYIHTGELVYFGNWDYTTAAATMKLDYYVHSVASPLFFTEQGPLDKFTTTTISVGGKQAEYIFSNGASFAPTTVNVDSENAKEHGWQNSGSFIYDISMLYYQPACVFRTNHSGPYWGNYPSSMCLLGAVPVLLPDADGRDQIYPLLWDKFGNATVFTISVPNKQAVQCPSVFRREDASSGWTTIDAPYPSTGQYVGALEVDIVGYSQFCLPARVLYYKNDNN